MVTEMKVQLFFFGDDSFLPSDISSKLPCKEDLSDWDYALVATPDGTETAYINNDTEWLALDEGTNPWGLCFVESTDWVKYEEPHAKFKSLANK
jgi:hypothetical protein